MTDKTGRAARARRAEPARPGRGPGSEIRHASDLLNLELATVERLFEGMTSLECTQFFHDWTLWARDDQAPPHGNWIIWLILAGRGAGKTRAGAEAVRSWARTYPIVNLIGATIADARDIMVRGESGFSPAAGGTSAPAFSPPTFGLNGRTAR